MPVEITMPQLSDTMAEGTLVRWNKKEGDRVRAGEEIAEVETDKATMPMEAFEGGTVAAIVVPEGGKVKVGGLIAVLAAAGENPAELKKQLAGGAGSAKQPAAAPTQGGGGSSAGAAMGAGGTATRTLAQMPGRAGPGAERVPAPAAHHGSVQTMEGASLGEMHEPDEVGHGATRTSATAVPPLPATGGAAGNGQGTNGGGGGGRVLASPLARRIAADKGLDLAQIRGSGPGGRVVQKDVLAVADRPPQPPRQQQPASAQAGGPAAGRPAFGPRVPTGERQVVPMSKMRSAIAAALQRSKQTIPHFYETVDVDVEELSTIRGRINAQLERDKVKLSIADFIAKAVCAALMKHPDVNATFDENKREITRYGDVNLGIAVAVPDGLIVPVLRGADQMGLRELRERSAELIDRARAQRLKQDEMTGGTFTISSLGTYGVREFSAIINPPQVAILAVGGAEKRAVVRGDQVVARTVMTLTLSADHRAVDGAAAAEFLRTLKGMLEEPGMMLV